MTTPRDPDGSARITPDSTSDRTADRDLDRFDGGADRTVDRTVDRTLDRDEHTTTDRSTGTRTGADVTGRMAGTGTTGTERVTHTETVRPREREHGLTAFKTSAAAVFALVFGLAALFCALTAILAPAAVLFGVIGLILGIVGLKMAKRPNVTGKGVAIGGLVTSLLGLLLGGAVLAGAAVLINDEGALDRITDQVDDLRDVEIPSGDQVQDAVTPG